MGRLVRNLTLRAGKLVLTVKYLLAPASCAVSLWSTVHRIVNGKGHAGLVRWSNGLRIASDLCNVQERVASPPAHLHHGWNVLRVVVGAASVALNSASIFQPSLLLASQVSVIAKSIDESFYCSNPSSQDLACGLNARAFRGDLRDRLSSRLSNGAADRQRCSSTQWSEHVTIDAVCMPERSCRSLTKALSLLRTVGFGVLGVGAINEGLVADGLSDALYVVLPASGLGIGVFNGWRHMQEHMKKQKEQ